MVAGLKAESRLPRYQGTENQCAIWQVACIQVEFSRKAKSGGSVGKVLWLWRPTEPSCAASRWSKAGLTAINIFVKLQAMEYEIRYYSEAVQDEILDLPDTLAARYVVLTRRMVALGPNLGEPHTKAMKGGLFELRLKGAEGLLGCSTARRWADGS